jgi:hypothetical protein
MGQGAERGEECSPHDGHGILAELTVVRDHRITAELGL